MKVAGNLLAQATTSCRRSRPSHRDNSGIVAGLPPFELGYARTDLRRTLVEAVLRGEKTATASLLTEYRPDEPIARPGDEHQLLGYNDEPLGVVKTTDVQLVRAGDVDLQFARDEGEGFDTVAAWRSAHERFWAGQTITDDTLIVCQRFTLIERY